MTLKDLAISIGAKILTNHDSANTEIMNVFAGDRMSDLLSHVSDTTLLVTNLSNAALMRVTDLMDLPAICLVSNVEPSPAMIHDAEQHGVTLLLSPEGMFETCGRLYQVMMRDVVRSML